MEDLNGIVTGWNKSAERLFGYTAAEAVGQPVTILIPPDRLNEEPEIIARIKERRACRSYRNHSQAQKRRLDRNFVDHFAG